MGCVVFPGEIPTSIENGIIGRGFPIEVFNVLGAGDAFMGGFLRGWLKNEPHSVSATWANACGAFAVSRLLCSPEYPTWPELQTFLETGSPHRALRRDQALNHVHWATTRRTQPEMLFALAIDHRAQLEKLADEAGVKRERIGAFKRLAVRAAAQVANGRPDFGMLLDGTYGREALFDASKHGLWIGRPVEEAGSRPLRFEESADIGSRLIEWPVTQTVKCLVYYHPEDDAALKADQLRTLGGLYDATRRIGRELLVEIISSKHGTLDGGTTAQVLRELYGAGIRPDWWKLEAQPSAAAWSAIDDVIRMHDPLCRGVVVLGLEASEQELMRAFDCAVTSAFVKGFAVGRTIFAEPAKAWLAGRISDEEAVHDLAGRFRSLLRVWEDARATRAA
jgi:5-dehydro-2-deoxygluconokinase